VLVGKLLPVGIPPGWKAYVSPRFTTKQRFGPLTALVHARAIAIAQSGPEQMRVLVELAMCARRIGSLGQAVAVAFATAREFGRVAAVESVMEESSQLASWLVFNDRTDRWSQALELFTQGLDAGDERGRHEATHALRDLLALAVTATLMTQVVADVASEEALLMGMGTWLAAASDTGLSPGPRWHAPRSVVAQVQRLITSRADGDWTDLLDRHDLALRGDLRATSHGEGYGDVVSRLLGMAVTSAALFPPVVVQVSGMPARPGSRG
jgi:hypothetical protein